MLRLFNTRPGAEGESLSLFARQQGWSVSSFPLVSISAGAELAQLARLNTADVIIAVSHYAIDFAAHWLSENQLCWPGSAVYIAVGNKTAQQWLSVAPPVAYSPIVPEQETSEGLLKLPQLQQVADQQVMILRGDSGRELLAQTLRQRGAKVSYIACYQRELIKQNQIELVRELKNAIEHAGFPVLLGTSEQLLCYASEGLSERQRARLLLVVPSQRIMDTAKQLGYLKIYQSRGASNGAIIETLSEIKKRKNDGAEG